MARKRTVVHLLVQYTIIMAFGYAFAVHMEDHFPKRIIIFGIFMGCCVDAILWILDWPKDPGDE